MGQAVKIIGVILVVAGVILIALGVIAYDYEKAGWFKGWMFAIAGIPTFALGGRVLSLK